MLYIDESNIGRDSSYFQSTDTDSTYTVKPVKYFGLSQEQAGVHAALKGVGLKEMLDKEGRTWMILRTRMTINKLASWMDEYRTETWCQEGFKLYCPRLVRAYDSSNTLLFSSESLWVIMDMVKLRPERPSYISERLEPIKDKEKEFNPDFPKFPLKEEYKAQSLGIQDIKFDYYDYDYNKHINNLSYINWTFSSFPSDYLDSYRPTFIDTEWKKQCHFEDKLFVETTKKNETEEAFFTSIFKEKENGEREEVFHLVSQWEKKNER